MHALFDRAARAAQASSSSTAATEIDRRRFVTLGGAVAGAVPFAFALGLAPDAATAQAAAAATELKPSQLPGPFVAIAADGSVTVQVNRLDFGQGVNTALPMLVAEEMDADWARTSGALAPAGMAYADPMFGMQMTGGSSSVANSWTQYREIGARARAMLVAAAARRWSVPADRITVANGVVSGPAGQRAHFGELAAAAMAEPVPTKVTLKAPGDYKLLGKPQTRKNARQIARGRQSYGIDFGVDPATRALLPGLKTVLVARPPVWGGKVAGFDAAAAKKVRGVHAAFEVELDRGGRGVAVVADGYWAARQGRDALAAKWNLDGLTRTDSAAQLANYAQLAGTPGRNAPVKDGLPFDAARLAGAPRKLSAEYRFPYLAHAPMEPLNCVIDVQGEGAATLCRVWSGTQFQTVDQGAIARTLGLSPEQVRLDTMMAGGGFGRRAVPSSDYLVEAAQVAKAWRAGGGQGPLKLMWTREDDIRGGYYRPAHVHRAEIGLAANGAVEAWQHRIVGQSILMGTPFEAFLVKDGIDGVTVEGVADTPYRLPLRLEVHHPQANVPVLWWRSVGHTHTAYVMETLADEIAQAAGLDPVEWRRAQLGSRHPRHRAALDLAVAESGYGRKTLPAGTAFGVALHESFGSVVAMVVEATLAGNEPRLVRVTAGVHCNFAVNPRAVEAQVQGAVAMGMSMCLPGGAITLKDGVVEQSNFFDYQVPRLPAMPPVAVHIVQSGDAPTGMGEPGLPPLAPAWANAMARLTGKRLRELPFRLG
jgi:isoquinoline 1-oxidoreductase beta subunit